MPFAIGDKVISTQSYMGLAERTIGIVAVPQEPANPYVKLSRCGIRILDSSKLHSGHNLKGLISSADGYWVPESFLKLVEAKKIVVEGDDWI